MAYPRARGRPGGRTTGLNQEGARPWGATAPFPRTTTRAPAARPLVARPAAPPPSAPTNQSRFALQNARFRHEKGTKRTWFGHGFSPPAAPQPPPPPPLAPPQKTL